MIRPELVVVGGSWGGLDAASDLLSRLGRPTCVPILLVLHRHRTSDSGLIERLLAQRCGLDVVELGDKDRLEPGRVHLAPADYHVLVDSGGVSLSVDGPVNYSRPSLDLAFESAAVEHGESLVAVLLTGAGKDGAEGIAAVKGRGGRTLVQDPQDALRPEIPRAALQTGQVDVCASVPELGARLRALLDGAAG
jgi:two-component system, chemotaxis family, protein-glutamate methylesterase/glutaminase